MGITAIEGVLIGTMFALAAASFYPMVDEDGAKTTLADAHPNLTDVKVGGYSYFGCGTGDTWHTKFVAKNQQGKEVSGVVCKGILKGSTVRFD